MTLFKIVILIQLWFIISAENFDPVFKKTSKQLLPTSANFEVKNAEISTCAPSLCYRFSEFKIAESNKFICNEEHLGVIVFVKQRNETMHAYLDGKRGCLVDTQKTGKYCRTIKRY